MLDQTTEAISLLTDVVMNVTSSSAALAVTSLADDDFLSAQLSTSSPPPDTHNKIHFNVSFLEDMSNVTSGANVSNLTAPVGRDLSVAFQIPMYVIIFTLSIVGNVLVIVTVLQNKKMRSVTNVFLLNLSVSDLLLAAFCMPFTLIPMFLRNFIFGEAMCIIIRYLQGVSVGVSCFTLVAISLERYFAICHPLKSRRWQTLSHSYKAIAVCWACALAVMMPTAIVHHLRKIGPERYKCMEDWPSVTGQRSYTVILNLILLVIPVVIMCWAYGRVSHTLWMGIKMERQSEKENQSKNGVAHGQVAATSHGVANYDCQNGVSIFVNKKVSRRNSLEETDHTSSSSGPAPTKPATTRPFRRFEAHRAMRQSNTQRSRAAKKRVIKMLFIIVVEFFLFWAPVYIIETWMTFDFRHASQYMTPLIKALVHLFSYVSACCNPITYCFMNKSFRQSFLMAFRCSKKRYVYAHRSQMSFSGNTASTRAPASTTTATSYDKIVDSDDISENSF
ncbi:cholecystokinin receptor-like [Physella acuta]|uniref:cholecystokinin receptor-like n=1 Tax=Physella acuta TaxID=109671 RepID=UPI0027DADB46|nr:cholecystokinin receptor-like [Physella acuta]